MIHDPALHRPFGTSPTADLYFGWSMAREISCGAIRQVSPTVFVTDRHVVVCRKGPVPQGMLRGRQLIYLIDDDIRAGIRSREVPLPYRAKLAWVEGRQMRALERRAELIVTSSPVLQQRLAARHPGTEVAYLSPTWPLPAVRRPGDAKSRIEIALLMGMSHARNVRPIFPELLGLLRRPDVQLTISANLAPPDALVRHRQVTILPVLGWQDYLTALQGRAFDLMLYPMPGTCAFNAARSVSKLGEAARFGAALVVGAGWCERVGVADPSRVLSIGAEGWGRGLARLVDDRALIARTAEQNRLALLAEDAPAQQHRFWSERLGLA